MTGSLDDLMSAFGMKDRKFGRFKPGAFYNQEMDWLIFLIKDATYLSASLSHGDLEVLWDAKGKKIIGVKIWDISKRPNGADLLQRAGLIK